MKHKRNPINAFHNFRRLVHAVYEKKGLDKALDLLETSKVNKRWKNGIEAEIAFYDGFKSKLGLSPLLDVMKADYVGLKTKRPTYYDVTTNLSCKNPEEYIEYLKKSRNYEIVIYDKANSKFDFLALRLPICDWCGGLAYYILFIGDPVAKSNRWTNASDIQSLVKYCLSCDDFKETEVFNYLIPLPIEHAEELQSYQSDAITREPDFNFTKYLSSEGSHIGRFVQKLTQNIISAVVENQWVWTSKDDGDWFGRILWRHQFAGKGLQMYKAEKFGTGIGNWKNLISPVGWY